MTADDNQGRVNEARVNELIAAALADERAVIYAEMEARFGSLEPLALWMKSGYPEWKKTL